MVTTVHTNSTVCPVCLLTPLTPSAHQLVGEHADL